MSTRGLTVVERIPQTGGPSCIGACVGGIVRKRPEVAGGGQIWGIFGSALGSPSSLFVQFGAGKARPRVDIRISTLSLEPLVVFSVFAHPLLETGYCVAQAGLELYELLTLWPPPEFWDYRCPPPYPVYMGCWGLKPRALCMPDNTYQLTNPRFSRPTFSN